MKTVQFHLSTAIAMSFIPGAVLYLNLRPWYYNPSNEYYDGRAYGWPSPVYVEVIVERRVGFESYGPELNALWTDIPVGLVLMCGAFYPVKRAARYFGPRINPTNPGP